MAFEYRLVSNNREGRPRSKRLRRLGVSAKGAGGNNILAIDASGVTGGTGDHTHENKKSLDQITIDEEGYINLTRDKEVLNEETGEMEVQTVTEKGKVGFADLAYDLAKDSPITKRFLSREDDDTAAGVITFLKGLVSHELARLKGGAEFGEFISGMFTGTGGAVDKNGNAEFQGVKIRGGLWAMEYIVNRLEAQEGDTVFTESDTIEEFTDNGDGTYLLKLRSKYDGYFTAMTPGMVVRGIVNTLATGGKEYYTSWVRVNSVNASANTIEVSMYPDAEVPGGENFPPCELMRITRWGHQTDKGKQSIYYISSTEGRIVKLFGVDRPIIDFSNYELALGTLPEKIHELLPIPQGESGLYVKHLIAENIWKLDHQGKPLPTIRDRGPYDPAQRYYSGDTLRVSTNDFEHSDVWYFGCRWRCMVTGTTEPPKWNSTAWQQVEGNPAFTVEFEEGNRIWLDPDNIYGTLTLHATRYNQDITPDIALSDIQWTRYSEDSAGIQQVASDNIWAMAHASVGKQLEITAADFNGDPLSYKRIEFRCTVTLRDGMSEPVTETVRASLVN